MRRFRRSRPLAGTAACLAAFACTSPLPPTLGSNSDVGMLCDADTAPAAAALRAGLEEPAAGESEAFLRVEDGCLSPAPAWRRRPQVVVAACLAAPGEAAGALRAELLPHEVAAVRRDGAGRFLRRDLFAADQCVVLLAALRPAALDSLVQAAAPIVRSTLDSAAVAHAGRALYAGGRARPLAGPGFELLLPPSYSASAPSSGWAAAVEIVRPGPTRTLTVFWLDDVEAARAGEEDFQRGLQRDVLWRMHGDELVESTVRCSPASLDLQPARRLEATWQNRRDVGGGSLCTWFVHDARHRRLYGVQTLVFAPGREKRPYLRELQAVAATFHLEEPT